MLDLDDTCGVRAFMRGKSSSLTSGLVQGSRRLCVWMPPRPSCRQDPIDCATYHGVSFNTAPLLLVVTVGTSYLPALPLGSTMDIHRTSPPVLPHTTPAAGAVVDIRQQQPSTSLDVCPEATVVH